MPKILGIDLGTTNSAMAFVEGGEPRIIENKEGNRTTPSIVAVSKSGELLSGLLAKRQAVTNPKGTVFSVKRLIGRKFSDPEVERDKKLLPYELRQSSDGGVEVKMGEKWYRPAEISAMILRKLKNDAEDRLGEKIEEVVITVPAYFDDSQRKATKDAGEIAGFKVRRIINEPTAAALAYGFGAGKKGKDKEEKIVVYDFGGGTFDVSVLEVSKDTVEVKATGGDTHLGGDDMDQKIINYLVEEFKKEQGIDLSKDPLALQRLKEAAERAKHELSSVLETEVNIPFITTGDDGPKHFLLKLKRSRLVELADELITRSINKVAEVLKEAGLGTKDVDEIIMVGGQTRMPAIQEAVKKFFGKDPHRDINPDEVVASGAAVQAGIMQGDVKDVLLLDVTPLSLGIETLGGVNTVLIPKNTTIPTSKTQVFSTAADNQPQVEIHVLQGERPMSADNRTLGRFILDGIPPAPRGMPQIEVAFDIDANGILSVTAKDKATGKSQSIKIEGSSGLSNEEIERMRQEAESHQEEDRKKKDLIEARNVADTLVYSTEKSLRELGDKVPQDTKKEIQDKIENVKKELQSENADSIRKAAEELSSAVQKIGADLYQQSGEDKNADSGATKEKSGEEDSKGEPEEAEFEEK